MQDPYVSYVLDDVRRKVGARIEYEDLPHSVRISVRNAAAVYRRLLSVKNTIMQLSTSKGLSFRRSKYNPDLEKFKKEYDELLKEYENLINAIAEKAKIALMDFSELREMLKHSGIILQPIKCPECGAPIKLPESGKFVECPYCGHTLRVIDAYEILSK